MLSDLRKNSILGGGEGSQGSLVCPPGNSNMHMRMTMAHWRSDTNMRKPKHLEKTLFQCHSIHYKSHKDWPGMETEPPR